MNSNFTKNYIIQQAQTYSWILPTLILTTPFFNFLTHNQVKITSSESLLALTTLALASTLCWVVMIFGGRIVSCLIVSGLITLFIDLEFDVVNGKFSLIITFVALAGIVWSMGKNFYLLGTVIFAMFFLVGLAQAVSSGISNQFQIAWKLVDPMDKPPPRFIHLILDEHIGIEGIPENVPGGIELKERLTAFYQKYQFNAFGGAYSHFFHTGQSVSTMLNFSDSSSGETFLQGGILQTNRYFEELSKYGYHIHARGSGHVDFCKGSHAYVTTCGAYPLRGLISLSELNTSLTYRFETLWGRYKRGSFIYRVLRYIYRDVQSRNIGKRISLPPWNWGWGRNIHPTNSLLVMDQLWEQIQALPPGNMLFVHLLIPHDPYMLDSNCRVKPPSGSHSRWKGRTIEGSNPVHSPESRAKHYAYYFDQLNCLYKRLEDLFERMKATEIYENSVIVLHGDHGSRIVLTKPTHENKERLTPQDLVDGYSTLFAFKYPRSLASYHTEVQPLEQLLENSPVLQPKSKRSLGLIC